MVQLYSKKVVHGIVARECRGATHDVAKDVGHKAEARLASIRATTKHRKIHGPSHLTQVTVTQGEVDSFVNLEAPNPMAEEFGHEPSGYFAGTDTKSPEGLYIITGAAGLTE